jgi:Domain of unknown function (DUF4190)
MTRVFFTFILLFGIQFSFASQASMPVQPHGASKVVTHTFKSKLIAKYHRIEKALGPDENTDPDVLLDGFAVAGFICSITGLFASGIALGILGIVFSCIAMRRIRNAKGKWRGSGYAVAGLVFGIIALGRKIILSQQM